MFTAIENGDLSQLSELTDGGRHLAFVKLASRELKRIIPTIFLYDNAPSNS